VKPKILYHPQEHSNLLAVFLEPIWREYFDIEPIDFGKHYDPRQYAIWVKQVRSDDWYRQWQDLGHKIIIDHFWDSEVTLVPTRNDQILTMRMPNWAWYNESLWYQHLGYDRYRRSPDRKYFFFMAMRKRAKHRDEILAKMQPLLEHSLYSYVHRGKFLFGDLEDSDVAHQRYLNPQWYDTTQFSMVVETVIDDGNFVSEKIFKPLAFQHAFIVWAGCGVLDYLKTQGFETFSHRIDESYNQIIDSAQRLEKIFQAVYELYKDFQSGKDLFMDPESQAKLEHNRHHFYHSNTRNWFIRDGVDPIREFLES
jgi:hypothetical protein